jgi:hypothetical protein
LSDRIWGDVPFRLNAGASSGLTVAFSIVSGPASITSNLVTITGVGPVVVRAEQPGDNHYYPAPSIDRSFTIAKAGQSIQFAPLTNRLLADPPFTLSANASSGLPVRLEILSGPATITDNLLTPTSVGTVIVRASQPGDDHFKPAANVDRSFAVTRANQAPAVAIEEPINNETFKAPARIPIEARALDTDGTVVLVEFFEGATKLGEVLFAPYQFSWNNVPAGQHAIQARATDDLGASTLSLPVTISVIPNLLQPEVLANGTFRFTLSLEPGKLSTIERSDDLLRWTPIASKMVDATGNWQFVDPIPPGMHARFYRLASPHP